MALQYSEQAVAVSPSLFGKNNHACSLLIANRPDAAATVLQQLQEQNEDSRQFFYNQAVFQSESPDAMILAARYSFRQAETSADPETRSRHLEEFLTFMQKASETGASVAAMGQSRFTNDMATQFPEIFDRFNKLKKDVEKMNRFDALASVAVPGVLPPDLNELFTDATFASW